MSESNCRGWEIVSSAKKRSVSTISSPPLIHTRFQPGGPDDSYSQNRFNGFHPRDTDKALKRLEEIQCERQATRLKPGENEKKSACRFWMNASRKKREGGQSPPSRQYQTICK